MGEYHGWKLERGLRTAVDVDAVLEAVDGGDLALTSLVAAAHDGDFVLRKVSIQMTAGYCVVILTSLRMGMLRTPCFSRSSLLRGA
jgi:hypothetical protein